MRSEALRKQGGHDTIAEVREELDQGKLQLFLAVLALMPNLLTRSHFY